MTREGRGPAELRPVAIQRGYTEMTPGSVLVELGGTRVLCTVSVDDSCPAWLRGSEPGLAHRRVLDAAGLEPAAHRPWARGRSQAGRRQGDPAAHRPLAAGGRRSRGHGRGAAHVDCDVLQADGGTRTASITRRLGGAGRRRATRLVACGRLAGAARWPTTSPPSRSGSSATRSCSTSPTPRTCAPRSTERRDDRRRGADRGAGHRRGRAVHAAPSSTRCSTSPTPASPSWSTCSAGPLPGIGAVSRPRRGG